MNESEVERIEVRLLLEAVYQRYGYDFREYALSTMKRRILRRMEEEKLPTITALQDRLLRDPAVMERLLMDFSITTSTMFRDPGFFRCLRKKVVPPFLACQFGDNCICCRHIATKSDDMVNI